MVMHRNGENPLGVNLADHIIVQYAAYVLGRWHPVLGPNQSGLVLLTDNIHAQFHAFIADEYGRSGNELTHFVLALAAERAIQGVSRITTGRLSHGRSVTLTVTERVSTRQSGGPPLPYP